MYWSWDVAFDVLPQLARGVVVTVQATIVASLLAFSTSCILGYKNIHLQ